MSLTTVEELSPKEFTTPGILKRRLRVTGSEDDELLEDLIREASSEIVSYCRRPFARARVRESPLHVEDGALVLSLTPVVEVHSVSRGGEPILDFEVEDDDAGILTASRGVLSQGESLWWNDPFRPHHRETYEVEYTGGFLMPQEPGEEEDPAPPRTLPYGLEAVVIEMVSMAYVPADEAKTGAIKSVKVEDITYQYETAGRGGERALQIVDRLDRWRRVA